MSIIEIVSVVWFITGCAVGGCVGYGLARLWGYILKKETEK